MFYTWHKTRELSKTVRQTPFEGVSDELRGWSWTQAPVAPLYDVKLGVSDIVSGFCETGRNVYLKYVERKRQKPNKILERGYVVHATHEAAVSAAKEIIYAGQPESGEDFLQAFLDKLGGARRRILQRTRSLEREKSGWIVDRLWKKAALIYSAEYEKAVSRSAHLSRETIASLVAPEQPEFAVDGTPVGLTPTLKLDSLLPSGIIVEIKTRPYRDEYLLALAGYALALESMFSTPTDFGVLAQVVINDTKRDIKIYEKVVPIGEELRSLFVQRRDRLQQAVAEHEDPGMPARCSPACPYLHVCNPTPERVSTRP